MISLRSRIEKLEKEKKDMEGKLQGLERSPSGNAIAVTTSPQIKSEDSQKGIHSESYLRCCSRFNEEIRALTEAKTKLEGQLEKSKVEIMQLQTEKDQSAKDLLAMKTGTHLLLLFFAMII